MTTLLLRMVVPTAVKDVQDEPQVTLQHWKIMELPNGQRHFVGVNAADGSSRVSTAIVEFDHVTFQGKTASGRVYQLEGPQGEANSDSLIFWQSWQRACGIGACREIDPVLDAAGGHLQ